MSNQTVAQIEKNVREARAHALASEYNDAVDCYMHVKNSMSLYIHSLGDAVARAQWTVLLQKVEEEERLVEDLMNEQRVISDSFDVGAERKAPLNMGSGPSPSSLASTKIQPKATGRDAPSGSLNQQLYGDRDRFGPPEGPKTATTKPPVPSRYASAAAPARTGAATTTRKPVGKRTSSRQAGPRGNRQGQQNKDGNAIERFTGRAGEQELVQLIEADMHVGKLPVTWEDIAGLDEAKRLLEEAVVYPVLMPDYYQGIRRPWKGVLMYGPPGTGKTMLAKAVASECNTTFFNISPATLTSKWRGDSEKLIRILFEMARHYAPSTIFIDEIDSLCGQRGGGEEHEASRRAKGTLLAQMDGVGVDGNKIVMVLGATNHPWDIDEAMRRRLEKRIYIPLPDLEDRIELFKINTQSLQLSADVDFRKLSEMLEGHFYSCADITSVARDAAMMTMRRYMKEVDKTILKENAAEIGRLVAEQPTSMQDFLLALKKVPSSINVENIKKFEKWKKEFEFNV